MEILTESAFAKLNLTLDVLSRREDGYHDIRSVEQTISLRDDVVLNIGTGRKWALHCYQERVRDGAEDTELATEGYPQDAENLAWRAAEVFFDRTGHDPEGLEIFINKRIPMQAGLGGGSADAAAVLRRSTALRRAAVHRCAQRAGLLHWRRRSVLCDVRHGAG